MLNMSNPFYYLLSFLAGAVISIMVICNTEFGLATTSETSLIINQIVGIILLTIVLFAGRNNPKICPKRKKTKWYMWYGGLFGVGVITFNYYSVSTLGATLAMASAVFGQNATALFMDLTGFMGMTKQKISPVKWIALGVSFLGILIMCIFSGGDFSVIYLLMGIAAGFLTMTQMSYNSTFANAKGAVFSARQNVISGLFGSVVYAAIFFPSATVEGFKAIPSVPFYLIIAGGTLACFVVISSNIVVTRIPAVYSSLLMTSGQILTSLVLDGVLYSRFDLSLLTGVACMMAGMFINFYAEKKEA